MKKIVISGATSFLGYHTVKCFLDKGYQVYALVRPHSKNISNLTPHKNLKIIEFEFENPFAVINQIVSTDYFINFAWDSYGGRANDDVQIKNVEYSLKMLELAKRLGAKKFIFPGSQAEYGQINGLICDNTVCSPVSAYGKAKLQFGSLGKKYATENGIDFIHLRIFSVYGYGDRPNTLVDYCIKSFLIGATANLGCCLQKWNYLYVDDFAEIIEKLITADVKTRIINIASPDTKIMREFVKQIYEVIKCGNYTFENNILTATVPVIFA